jgi:hypothetical protein
MVHPGIGNAGRKVQYTTSKGLLTRWKSGEFILQPPFHDHKLIVFTRGVLNLLTDIPRRHLQRRVAEDLVEPRKIPILVEESHHECVFLELENRPLL